MQRDGATTTTERVVVVVDDDPAVRNSLKFSLEVEGYKVRLCRSGDELLHNSGLPKSGCLVIDYNMPGMNGLELLGALRGSGCSLPAILVTSHPNVSLRQRVLAAGARFVEKPFLGPALAEAISEALAKQV